MLVVTEGEVCGLKVHQAFHKATFFQNLVPPNSAKNVWPTSDTGSFFVQSLVFFCPGYISESDQFLTKSGQKIQESRQKKNVFWRLRLLRRDNFLLADQKNEKLIGQRDYPKPHWCPLIELWNTNNSIFSIYTYKFKSK